MKRSQILSFILATTALALTFPIHASVEEMLTKLKQQAEENQAKIKQLENHLNLPKTSRKIKNKSSAQWVKETLIELKHQTTENYEKIKQLEVRLNTQPSIQNIPQNTKIQWPERYIPVPNTNSALQLMLNPNLAITYDFNAFTNDFISPSTIPLQTIDGNASKSGHFGAQARATQIGFRTLSFTNIGEIKTEVSFDFYGTANPNARGIPTYQPRLRFGFIEFQGFTVGQTTSNFLDLDSMGETIDYGTIVAGSFRHALVQYAFNLTPKVALSLSLERPVTDYTEQTGNLVSTHSATNLPDFTAQLKYSDTFGHIGFRALLRKLRVKNYSNINDAPPALAQTLQATGWGLGFSGKVFLHKSTNIFAQTSFGEGIGRFIILCDGQAAFYDQTRGIFDRQKAMNAIIGLQHFWTESLRSNIIYARTKITPSANTPTLREAVRVTNLINQVSLNIIYTPTPPLDLGLEYEFADRSTIDFKRGKANRLTMGIIYRF